MNVIYMSFYSGRIHDYISNISADNIHGNMDNIVYSADMEVSRICTNNVQKIIISAEPFAISQV